ncbi:MAG: hypothetical protein ACAH95_16385 [Fimbriimonas sp.]
MPLSNQINIPRVEEMSNVPARFEVPDWREIALGYANLVFDLNAEGEHMPLVWLDQSHTNYPEDSFGLYVTVADPRCGPDQADGTHHDAVGDIAAVIASSLIDIDMTSYKGQNWVRMCRGYFNKANGRNVFMEFPREFDPAKTGGGYGRDFWYDVLPSLLAMELGSLYPQEQSLDEPLRVTADQFLKAAEIMLATPEGFAWSTFDWKAMEPVKNFIPTQDDAAGGFGELLLLAYHRFGDRRYLDAAKRCLEWLDQCTENPLYDAMLPDGVYAMARMNAEHETTYDVAKQLNWCFQGGFKCVGGVRVGMWGDYDISGLAEMRLVDRAYACETFKMAKSLVPMVRYDPRFARAIGKWMLNAASNMRLFYPDYLPPEHQMAPEYRDVTRGVIGYEALTTRSMWGDRPAPFAERDDWRDTYTPSGELGVWPKAGHYSLYGSSYVGFFGGMIERTSDERILQLDCLKTDFAHTEAFPTHLLYNPYDSPGPVTLQLGPEQVDLYDAVQHRFVAKGVNGECTITLEPDAAAVLVRTPANASLTNIDGALLANGVMIDPRPV